MVGRAALWTLLWCSAAMAQPASTNFGTQPCYGAQSGLANDCLSSAGPIASAGSRYQGPLDIGVAFTWWGGEQAYSNAYATSHGKAENVCTAAFASCEDETFNTDGTISYGTIATACTTTCLVKIWYNQVGNGQPDAIAASAGTAPVFTKLAVGTKGCAKFNGGANQRLGITNNAGLGLSQPYTLVVVEQNSNAGGFNRAYSGEVSGSGPSIMVDAGAGGTAFAFTAAGNVAGVAAGANFHAIFGMFNGAGTSKLVVDTVTTTNAGLSVVSSSPGGMSVGAAVTGGANSITGFVCAAGEAAGDVTGLAASLNTLLHNFWGF